MNPSHFEVVKCDECGSKEGLLQNKFNNRVMCESCLNFQSNEASALEDFNHGSISELHQEREA